jgi:hypothetical protein
MQFFLVAALLAQFGLLRARTQPQVSSLGAGRTAPTPPSLSPFLFLAMMIWLRIAICPITPVYRTQIPF